MTPQLDHLVWASLDLDAGVAGLASLTGVHAVAGGSHPGFGTRNALIGLGGRRYLEVLASDPEQPGINPDFEWLFGDADEPRLVTFAIAVADVQEALRTLRTIGYGGSAIEMSRRRQDGVELRWKIAFLDGPPGLPFVIEWGGTDHPADSAPPGCTLRSLRATFERLTAIGPIVDVLGVDVGVHAADDGRDLAATLDTPRGPVEL